MNPECKAFRIALKNEGESLMVGVLEYICGGGSARCIHTATTTPARKGREGGVPMLSFCKSLPSGGHNNVLET